MKAFLTRLYVVVLMAFLANPGHSQPPQPVPTGLLVNRNTGRILGPVTPEVFADANGLTGSTGPGAGGTVTNFSAGDLAGLFTTTEATTTTTPALGFTLTAAAANAVWAGPVSGGTGLPSYRLLVTADIPTLPLSKLATDPLARANHSGTQTVSTVAGLQAALDAKANASALPVPLTIALGGTNKTALGAPLTVLRVNAAGTDLEYAAPTVPGGGGDMVIANALSELTPNAAAARANLLLGSLATQNGTFSGSSSGTNTGDQSSVSGNAGTATALQTARAINGVPFDGTAAITVTAAAATLTGTTLASGIVSSSLTSAAGGAFGTGAYAAAGVAVNGAITPATKTKISYDAKGLVMTGADATTADIADSTNKRYVTEAALVVLAGTSGTNTGDQTTITGNAGSATVLQTARAINGVNFDGSAPITITAAAGTLTGSALASGVTTSSLTSAAGGVFGSAAFTAASAYLPSGTTTAGVPDSTNKRYVSDAHLVILGATSGANTGDQTTVSGNAGSATVLATARTINGVSFNGSTNITVPAAGSTLTDTVTIAKGGSNATTAAGAWVNFTIPTVTAGSTVIDWAAGPSHSRTLAANTTFTFANAPDGMTILVGVTNTASNYTVTWPTVLWSGGAAPTQTVGAKTDVYTFTKIGAVIHGSVVQNFF